MEKELAKIDSFVNGFLEFSVGRLGAITRYNTKRFIRPQNVMQHLGSTALIAMLLSDYLNSVGVKNDPERVLRMAVVHDIEEITSGDIPHELKYEVPHSAQLRSTLDKLTKFTLNRTLSLIGDSRIQREYGRLIAEEKAKETVEARIVKAADYIDVVIYTRLESKIGNKAMKEEETNAFRSYRKLMREILASRGRKS